MRTSYRNLILFFVGYNLVLAGILVGTQPQTIVAPRVVSFGNGDFSPLVVHDVSPNETDSVSKPFHADPGEVISAHLEEWATNNASSSVKIIEYVPSLEIGGCSACQVYLVALTQAGALGFTYPFGDGPSYTVVNASEFVLLFRPAYFLLDVTTCSGCRAGISGSLTIGKPQIQSTVPADLSIAMTTAGLVLSVAAVTLQARKRAPAQG